MRKASILVLIVIMILSIFILSSCRAPADPPDGNGEGGQGEEKYDEDIPQTDGIARRIADKPPVDLVDGTYEVQSEPDARGYYSKLSMVVLDGEIVDVEYDEIEQETEKPKAPPEYTHTAALRSFIAMPGRLIETQDIGEVDIYTGATSSSEMFRELAKQAIDEAQPAQAMN